MKPGSFEYHRAHDLDEACRLLADAGEDAKVIAGGQSLVAMMNLRLARPAALIDIDRLPGLGHVLAEAGSLRIGALTRHVHLERHPGVMPGFELLRDAASLVGHLPIRARGTFGGSIAHADAAAEWCVLALLFDARIRAASIRGSRELTAATFFQGLFSTALAPDEILTEVVMPAGFTNASIREFSRRHGDFATALVAVGWVTEDGRIRRPRVALGGVADRPLRSAAAEELLEGEEPSLELFEAVGARVTDTLTPPADLHASAAHRGRVAGVLAVRALIDAAGYPPAAMVGSGGGR